LTILIKGHNSQADWARELFKPFNTLTSRLIQAVRKKTTRSHVALRRNISAPVRDTDLVEMSKDAESLVVCTQKNFFCWGLRVFLWVMSQVEDFLATLAHLTWPWAPTIRW